MNIAFMGIRGIPARYGGFETFAEEVAPRLLRWGHEVTVYGRSNNVAPEYHGAIYKGVRIVVLPTVRHKYLDTVAHTLISTLHALFLARYDVILMMNAANAPFVWIPKLSGARIALNVDGIERLRKKWNRFGRLYYRVGERLATWLPDEIVSDAKVIQEYYLREYGAPSTRIAYGTSLDYPATTEALDRIGIRPGGYVLYVTRFEPENNVHVVIEAFARVRTKMRLVIVGDAPYSSEYKKLVWEMASKDERVILPGFIYGQGYRELLAHASCYVQATEVGGTHPALLEAMGAGNCVIANGTAENIEVLAGCGITYRKNDPGDLARWLTDVLGNPSLARELGEKARERVANEYNWDSVALRYHELFVRMRNG